MTTAPRAAAPLGTGGVGVASAEVRVPGASEAAGLRVAWHVGGPGRRCEATAGT